MSDEALVLRSVEGPLARVTINRPDKLNALNRATIAALKTELRAVSGEPGVRAIILTGAGEKAFVAGADIAEMARMTPDEARAFSREGQALGRLIDELGQPVVAAIPGFALGGGCELALMCHLRVAGPKARFSQPEVGLGLIPGFGGTQRLARLIGEGRALEMVLGGKMIDAETALKWGLVNRIAEDGDVLGAAEALAKGISAQSPTALRYGMEAVRQGLRMPLEEALEFEASLFGLTFSTEDMKEGTSAFLDKRKAEFRGR